MRDLTYKEKKFVKGIAEGKPKYVAAMEAYDVKNQGSAAVMGTNILKKVNVQEALEKALVAHGITIDIPIAAIKNGMEATKSVVNDEKAYETDIPDHPTRLKASSMALNLMGVSRPEGGNSFTFIQVTNKDKDDYNL